MGRHQPPTNRSFYLSVAASTIRFAIIVALVLGGVVVINQAFPEGASGGSVTGSEPGGGGATSPSPSPTKTKTKTQPPATSSPTVTGTTIAVFNGTGVTGLAGDVTTALEGEGYIAAQDAADAPSEVAVTTIYYRANPDKVEAEYLANSFFKKLHDVNVAKLEPGSDVGRDVQVAIFLGNDYAAIA
jgi:hypothetical protein